MNNNNNNNNNGNVKVTTNGGGDPPPRPPPPPPPQGLEYLVLPIPKPQLGQGDHITTITVTRNGYNSKVATQQQKREDHYLACYKVAYGDEEPIDETKLHALQQWHEEQYFPEWQWNPQMSLHRAVYTGNYNRVSQILRNAAKATPGRLGVVVNEKDRLGNTPLNYSFMHGSSRMFKILIEQGGATVLASHVGYASIMLNGVGHGILIELLKSPTTRSVINKPASEFGGCTALQAVLCCHSSQLHHYHNIITALCNSDNVGGYADPNLVDPEGYPALHRAISKNGNNNNNNNNHNNNHHNNNNIIISSLLRAGANPNQRDGRGFTPLEVAMATNKSWNVVSLLLEAGATDDFLLHKAAAWDNYDTVQNLLQQQGWIDKINLVDPDGYTPLHRFLSSWVNYNKGGNSTLLPLLKTLLEQGADPNHMHPSGKTSLEVALLHFGGGDDSSWNVVRVLLENGAEPDDFFLHKATDSPSYKTAEYLIEQGPFWTDKINDLDEQGRSLLDIALEHEVYFETSLVSLLLQKGSKLTAQNLCNPNFYLLLGIDDDGCDDDLTTSAARDIINTPGDDVDGYTPLQHALKNKNENDPIDHLAIACLLDLGADPNLKDPEGYAPLHRVVLSSSSSSANDDDYDDDEDGTCSTIIALLELLLKAGADPVLKDGRDGKTALDLAISNNKSWKILIPIGQSLSSPQGP